VRRRDSAGAVRFVRRLVDEGADLLDFYGGLYEHLHNLMLFALPGAEAAESVPAEFHQAYRETAADLGLEDLLRATAILTDYEFAFRGTAHPEHMLEFLLLRLTLLDRTADVAALLDEVRDNQGVSPSAGGRADADDVLGAAPSRRESPAAEPLRERESRADEGRASGPRSEIERAWESVLEGVSSQKASLGGMLAGLKQPALEGDELVLSVPADQVFVVEALRETRNRRLVESVLATVRSRPTQLRLEVGGSAAPEEHRSPAFRRLDRDDPLVRRALEVFDGDLVS
jgi:DNA polymerase III gamma/tau subunit